MPLNLPENLWSSRAIRNFLDTEANLESYHGRATNPIYWFSAPQADTLVGDVTLRSYTPSPLVIDPHEAQKDFAVDLRKTLQKEYHFDGLWIVGWTHPPALGQIVRVDGDNCWLRLSMVWLDKDGDVKFTTESEVSFFEMIQRGVKYYAEFCANAYQVFDKMYGEKALRSEMGLNENNTRQLSLETLH